MLEKIRTKFKELYASEPQMFMAPGRINIIGEHTDYNEGFVLPAAIDKHIVFAVNTNELERHRFYSMDYHQLEELENLELGQKVKLWAQYLMGVLAQFQKIGKLNAHFDVVFGGNIPVGAGLSSSAALECGMAKAVNIITNWGLSDLELVKMAQNAEHEYARVQCGIMDQYASVFGKENQVFKLDCRDITHEYFPLVLNDYELILVNTNVKHSLASSEYNLRRQECERGVQYFKNLDPRINSLRMVKPEMIEAHKNKPDTISYQRCKYVVEEIARVEQAAKAIEEQDLEKLGMLLYQTHHGLRELYAVSCPELDFLVDQTKDMTAVLGSRMMGGGFGGCTLNLVLKSYTPLFKELMAKAYEKRFYKSPRFYEVELCEGVREVK